MGKWIILRLIQLNRREKCSQWKITLPVLSIEKIERRTRDGKKRNNLKILQLNIISIMNRKKVVSARISCKYRWKTKEGHNKIQKATQPKNEKYCNHEARSKDSDKEKSLFSFFFLFLPMWPRRFTKKGYQLEHVPFSSKMAHCMADAMEIVAHYSPTLFQWHHNTMD